MVGFIGPPAGMNISPHRCTTESLFLSYHPDISDESNLNISTRAQQIPKHVKMATVSPNRSPAPTSHTATAVQDIIHDLEQGRPHRDDIRKYKKQACILDLTNLSCILLMHIPAYLGGSSDPIAPWLKWLIVPWASLLALTNFSLVMQTVLTGKPYIAIANNLMVIYPWLWMLGGLNARLFAFTTTLICLTGVVTAVCGVIAIARGESFME